MELSTVRHETDSGAVPEAWNAVPLSQISDFITKGSTPTTYGFKWESSGILFLRSECVSSLGLDLDQSMYISPEAHRLLRRSEVRDGDLLITITGNVGRVVLLRGIGVANINQHIARIRIAVPEVDAGYVYHVLSQPRVVREFESITTGQAYPQISLKQVRDAEVPLPEIQEQRAIAAALSDIDALLDGLGRLIAKKLYLKQASIQKLLTGKTRLPGFEGSWENKTIGELATFHKGNGLSKSELSPYGSKPCVHYGELFTQYGPEMDRIFSRTNSISEGIASVENDVLMPTSDVTPNGLAKASCVLFDDVLLGGDILVMRTDKHRVLGTFLSYIIRTDEDQVLRLVTGSTVYHLYASDMANFALRLPPLAEQKAIVKVLSEMDAEIEALEQRRAKTAAVKQAMMQELLTGRTRLV